MRFNRFVDKPAVSGVVATVSTGCFVWQNATEVKSKMPVMVSKLFLMVAGNDLVPEDNELFECARRAACTLLKGYSGGRIHY